MAIQVVDNLDMNGLQILNHRLQVLTVDPTSPANGTVWYRSDLGQIRYRNSTATITLGADSGGDAATLGGQIGSYYLSRSNHTGTQTSLTISDFASAASSAAPVQSVAGRTGVVVLAAADVSGLGTAATKDVGVASGNVPILGVGGKLSTSVMPSLALTDVFVVASQAEMLALSAAEQGDVAIRSDLNRSFILSGGSPGTLANWKELLTPTDAVSSVNGKTGAVSLTTSDIAEGANLYYTDTRVRGNRLDQLQPPASNLNVNNVKVVSVSAPTAATDAANKAYVDTAVTGVAKVFNTFVPAGNTTAVITHGLGSQDVEVAVRRFSDNALVMTGVAAASTNTVTLTFAVAPTSNQYRVRVTA